MRAILPAAALVALSLGCASVPTDSTPVLGAPADVSALAGEWYGDYSGPSGRSGGIEFRLRFTDSAAVGEVVMSPAPGHAPDWAAPATTPRDRIERLSDLPHLSVTFIRVVGGRVSGTIESYEDPECRCVVTTVFEGALRGRVLEGEYRTYGADLGTPRVGRWRVERAAPRR